jgi:hypothetical protein
VNKRIASTLEKKIAACIARIGKERDKLDALLDEAESVRDSCREAVEQLESARDTLSQYV